LKTAQFDRSAYLTNWKRLHANYERYAYRKFKSALDEQVAPVVKHVKSYGGISQELASLLITKAPMETAYKDVYIKIGVRQAGSVLTFVNRLGKSIKSGPGFFSETWSKLMSVFYQNYSASRISDVTKTTREKVRQVLDDSSDLPISQQASYITDTLNDPEFNRNRALMIARTESTTAANYGAQLGGESADYETAKQWMAVEDSRTRPDHVDADGQVVAMDDTFVVGSVAMMYPGDVSAPANETINCRCSLVVVPLLSASGLPILKA
jgi:hypothetical protein